MDCYEDGEANEDLRKMERQLVPVYRFVEQAYDWGRPLAWKKSSLEDAEGSDHHTWVQVVDMGPDAVAVLEDSRKDAATWELAASHSCSGECGHACGEQEFHRFEGER